MLCKELMKTTVRTTSINEPTCAVADIMREANVGFMPVCDITKGKIVGSVTDRDITVRLVAERKPLDTPIEQIMTPAAVYCRPDDDIRRAQELMADYHVARLLCVDDSGYLAGVLSLSDIANRLPEQAVEALREISEREV
ncbi:MAG: CBS domain-containing protein [Candidatus Binataceae bacterium]